MKSLFLCRSSPLTIIKEEISPSDTIQYEKESRSSSTSHTTLTSEEKLKKKGCRILKRAAKMKRHRSISNCQTLPLTKMQAINTIEEKQNVDATVENKSRKRRKKIEIEHKVFCDVCCLGYTTRHNMEKHKKLKHSGASAVKAKREEPIVKRPELKVTDKPSAPPQPKQQTTTTDKPTETYFECNTCEKRFRHRYNLVRHLSVHNNLRPFSCHICGKDFPRSSGLGRHIKEHHYGVKNWPCSICEKKFAARSARDDHENTHTNNRPFVCETCGKAFRQKASLHVHKLFHSDVRRFECSVCGKKFRRASELKVHGYSHTGYRPHKCEVCGATFVLKKDIKKHMRRHEGAVKSGEVP